MTMTDPSQALPRFLAGWRHSRAASALELLSGLVLVLGHNVFRVLPNEVPILFVLGLLSVRLRDGSLSAMGFRRPPSWPRIVLLALGAAALRIVLGELVVDPLASSLWPPSAAPAGAASIAGNPWVALRWLLLVWTWAAFGEEIGYRGYLLTRAADSLGRTPAAWGVALAATSVLFGYGHFYKGPAGVVDSAVAGLVLGGVYLLSRRNLWAPILAHGFIDTVGIAALYFGWSS